MAQVFRHHLILARGRMADIHQMEYVAQVRRTAKIAFDHLRPAFLFALGRARKSVARQIHQQKFLVHQIIIDQTGFARLR